MTTDQKQNLEELKELALREGMALCGVADTRKLRQEFLIDKHISRALDYGISIGYRLSKPVLETIIDAPNQTYYFHYQRANILLDQTALKVAGWIHGRGYDALPIPASQIMDWDKQLGSVSHREIARHAGLGWYGKNNLIVNARHGSQVRYATILTDLPLATGSASSENCGACSACVSLCPAGAITETGFDRDACHNKLKEFTKIQKVGQMICGVCLKACKGRMNDEV